MSGKHLRRRAFLWSDVLAELHRSYMQNPLRVHRGLVKLGATLKRQATFKHGDVMAAVGAGKVQISLPCCLKGTQRVGLPAVIGFFDTFCKNTKAL
jgi:hypothetical protein